MQKLPSISIVIISWNNEKIIKKCLDYIAKQSYPKQLIEIINVDGGSVDRTTDVVRSFVGKFGGLQIIETKIKDQEPKRAIGIQKAKHDLICSIDPDVFITQKNWLLRMVEPIIKNKQIVGSQTLYYQYSPNETLINRYFALFGINDPVVYYLGKADRIPYFSNQWSFPSKVKDFGRFFVVEFNKEIPTMGANGVIFRKSAYLKTHFTQENFFHIDVIQDMVNIGLNQFAIVKNSVLHSTGSTFTNSIAKRVNYMNLHYYGRQQQRRYLLLDTSSKRDLLNLAKFTFFTLTIFQPLYLSFKGYLKKPDFAWFLHLPMCFGFLFAYAIAVFRKVTKL